MNNPFRALAIGAILACCAIACPPARAQANQSPADAAAPPPANAAAAPADPSANRSADRSADPPAGPAAGQPVGPLSDPPAAQPVDETTSESAHPTVKRLLGDAKAYYTAPLRWDSEQWAFFGGALGAVALAHHYDSNVRAHFVQGGSGIGGSTDDLQDALPAAALWVGTYIYSSQWHDRSGLTVTWAMLEAAGLSTVTSYAFKYAIRRSRPNETTDPNQWFSSGTSFPSEHASAAFAIGTVFAESGSGGYRWLTRAIGYGVAGFTAYERLKHNAHWLSDVVAGAALGGSTGIFIVDRTYGSPSVASSFGVVPVDGGLMLTYHRAFP